MEKIALKNSEIADRNMSVAISLVAGRSFAYKLAWCIADINECIEKQTKIYNDAVKTLFKAHGAKTNGNGGYFFDTWSPVEADNVGKTLMPEACSEEFKKLQEMEMEHEVKELMELPTKIKVKDDKGKEIEKDAEYEPIIFIMLKKFIKRT